MGLCACRMLENSQERRRSAALAGSFSTEETDEGDDACRPVINTVPSRYVRMVTLGTLTMIWASCMAVMSAVILAVPLTASEDGSEEGFEAWGLPAWPFFIISFALHLVQILGGWMLVNGAIKRSSCLVAFWLCCTLSTAMLYLVGMFIIGSKGHAAICMGIFAAFALLSTPCFVDVTYFYFVLRREERLAWPQRRDTEGYNPLENDADPDPNGGRMDNDGFDDLENVDAPPTPPSVKASRNKDLEAASLRKLPPSLESSPQGAISIQSPLVSRPAARSQDSQVESSQEGYTTCLETSSRLATSPDEIPRETPTKALLQPQKDDPRLSEPPLILTEEQALKTPTQPEQAEGAENQKQENLMWLPA